MGEYKSIVILYTKCVCESQMPLAATKCKNLYVPYFENPIGAFDVGFKSVRNSDMNFWSKFDFCITIQTFYIALSV